MAEPTSSSRSSGISLLDREPPDGAPLGGTREEAMQRLQIGIAGIGAMILLVGLASVIGTQADLAEQSAVPEAAPTTEPTAVPTQSDPLVDAGVVPDIQAESSPSPTPTPTAGAGDTQTQGTAAPADVEPAP